MDSLAVVVLLKEGPSFGEQIRMVVGDHSYVTGHSNDTVLQKYGISDPLLQGKGPEQHLPAII